MSTFVGTFCFLQVQKITKIADTVHKLAAADKASDKEKKPPARSSTSSSLSPSLSSLQSLSSAATSSKDKCKGNKKNEAAKENTDAGADGGTNSFVRQLKEAASRSDREWMDMQKRVRQGQQSQQQQHQGSGDSKSVREATKPPSSSPSGSTAKVNSRAYAPVTPAEVDSDDEELPEGKGASRVG